MDTSNIAANYEVEIRRLQDELTACEPGTDAYNAVQTELLKAMEVMNEMVKIDHARKGAKVDTAMRVATFVGGVILTPAVTYCFQKKLAKFIGTVEQMETFTSMAGRSMSSWFRWPK
jgi:hypothetical protein